VRELRSGMSGTRSRRVVGESNRSTRFCTSRATEEDQSHAGVIVEVGEED
jgi:hypothetical protein